MRHSLLGHDLEILKCIVSSWRLSVLAGDSRAIADCHGQCGELNQTLTAASHWFLLNVHICHFERLFRSNLLQELDKIEVLVVQWSHLLQIKSVSRCKKITINHTKTPLTTINFFTVIHAFDLTHKNSVNLVSSKHLSCIIIEISYLQLGQVGADRLFEMFVKLRHLVAVTGSQCGDFTIFQVGITGRDAALEIKHGYKNSSILRKWPFCPFKLASADRKIVKHLAKC